MISIEKLKGGYILGDDSSFGTEREIIKTTEELFEILLQKLEGRVYGKVIIE